MHVESSAIEDIAYEARMRRLTVRFKSGERYAYVGVPADVHQAFLAAPSKGRFFQERIRRTYGFKPLDAGGPVGGRAWRRPPERGG